MKTILSIIIIIVANFVSAQSVNWSTEKNVRKSITYSSFGFDHGATLQIGHGRYIELFKPLLVTADFSIPMGNDLLDDFKTRLGVQIPIYQIDHFHLTARLNAIFRRHETKLVRMINFGSEINITMGYHKNTWHIAGEFGFDKSISTHLKHSSVMVENYPSITDGWFIPSGGHSYMGIQSGKFISSQIELNIRLGITNAQFNDENSLIPFYTQIGVNYTLFKKTK